MTLIVLAVLATAWLAYFALWYRESRSASPVRRNSMQSFSIFLGALGESIVDPRNQRWSGPSGGRVRRQGELFDTPRTPQEAFRRRRHVMAVLTAAALASLLAVPSFGAIPLAFHLLTDLVLASFVYGAVRCQHAAAERDMNVRVLYPDRPALGASDDGVEPGEGVVVPLRRTANG